MSDQFLYANGINGITGGYLLEPQTSEAVALAVRDTEVGPAEHIEAVKDKASRADGTLGPLYDDPMDLKEAGWGVVFAAGLDPKVKERLAPLLKHREAMAGPRYHEFRWPVGANRVDSSFDFLVEHNAQPAAPADPDVVPFYLMLVGSPEAIPFEFQYGLDVDYAVGRVWFERDGQPDLDAFARYAESVVAAEGPAVRRSPTAAFFGVRHEQDPATQQSADLLVGPLRDKVKGLPEFSGWSMPSYLASEATKERLGRLLGGPETPALLFSACHGLGLPLGDPRQLPDQGALLCQDWCGPKLWGSGPVPPELTFSARDLHGQASLHGMIAFLFACYGAGTPRLDDYPHPRLKAKVTIAARPFLSRLAQDMLAHPDGGALAVVGHVDRGWPSTFTWEDKGHGFLPTYQNMIMRAMNGQRIGWALDAFNLRYSRLGAELADIQRKERYEGYKPDSEHMAYLWTATSDARAFVTLGDPAVKLNV
jgi:hypothetical protein